MATTISNPGWTLSAETDVIETTLGWTYAADPDWRYTDSNGHEHSYNHGYPTLELIVDASHWCLGNEGMYAHDQHEAVDESHYECLLCREVVEPDLIPPGTRTFMPGLTTVTLTALRSDGLTVEFVLDRNEVERITSASEADRGEVVLAIADAIDPGERYARVSFQG